MRMLISIIFCSFFMHGCQTLREAQESFGEGFKDCPRLNCPPRDMSPISPPKEVSEPEVEEEDDGPSWFDASVTILNDYQNQQKMQRMDNQIRQLQHQQHNQQLQNSRSRVYVPMNQ